MQQQPTLVRRYSSIRLWHTLTTKTRGPVALVGSGEFLPVMDDIDRTLLEGRPARAVFLPTAAALEGQSRIDYWVDLGLQHFRGLGIEAEPLLVLDRRDADDAAIAARVDGAGLIYLSGGNPAYLTDTLRDTVVWDAIRSAWESGCALAGCSAGAIALSAVVRDRFSADAPPRPALGIVGNLAVLPHFDRLRRFAPQLMKTEWPADITVVGVDEDTAIVGGPTTWTVMGRQRAWILRPGAEPEPHDAGSTIEFA